MAAYSGVRIQSRTQALKIVKFAVHGEDLPRAPFSDFNRIRAKQVKYIRILAKCAKYIRIRRTSESSLMEPVK